MESILLFKCETTEKLERHREEERRTLRLLEGGYNDYGYPAPKRGKLAKHHKNRTEAVRSYLLHWERKLAKLATLRAKYE